MKILVTGCAGFIGFHACRRLLAEGHTVVGVDSITDYYDTELKYARLNQLLKFTEFQCDYSSCENAAWLEELFGVHDFDTVIHLAAQPGVRHSLEAPMDYIQANIVGFLNVIEVCKRYKIKHLIFASSSSVYGENNHQPFVESQVTDSPISLYAATKKGNELMAHVYGHLYDLRCTGLRFFTVYGPWGRPDMSYFKFTKAIIEGTPINVYNNGNMWRDWTYIDDAVEAIIRVMQKPSNWPFDFSVYNVAHGKPERLMDMIGILEEAIGKKAIINYLPMQPGDVTITGANITKLQEDTGFTAQISIAEGLPKFVEWYKDYHGKRE